MKMIQYLPSLYIYIYRERERERERKKERIHNSIDRFHIKDESVYGKKDK